MKKLKIDIFFTILLILCGAYIVLSYPFFKIPYDMWDHMSRIAELYRENMMYYYCPFFRHGGRGYVWYKFWAEFFHLFHISSPWIWPRVIHVIQFSLIFSACFYFFKTLFDIIMPKSELNKYTALFSVVFWTLGLGFPSVAYHNTWIVWYSLNYQCMSMALFWFGSATALRLCFMNPPLDKLMKTPPAYPSKVFEVAEKKFMLNLIMNLFFLVAAFVLIVLIHPLESAYLTVHCAFIFLAGGVYYLFFSKLRKRTKVVIIMSIFGTFALCVILAVVMAIAASRMHFIYIQKLPKELLEFDFSVLYKHIMKNGSNALRQSKFPKIYSELLWGSILILILFPIYYAIRFIKKGNLVSDQDNGRRVIIISLYLTACTFFLGLIPLVKPLAGTIAILIPPEQIYRFIFTAPAYAVIPYVIALIIQKYDLKKIQFQYKKQLIFTLAITVFISVLIFISSFTANRNLYKNAVSMIKILDKKETITYDRNTIQKLKKIVDEQTPKDVKHPIYYLRGDMAMALHYYYGKWVYSAGKLGLYRKSSFYRDAEFFKDKAMSYSYKQYESKFKTIYLQENQLIDIDLPENLPKDISIFKSFKNFNKNYISFNNPFKAKGIVGLIYGNMEIRQAIPTVRKIKKIDLFMANLKNHNKNNNEKVFVKITDPKGKVLGETSCIVSDIKDNSWHSFGFNKDIKLDPKAKYNYIVITSPNSAKNNSVTIYKTKCYWGYKINGKWQNATLKMEIYSK